MHGTAHSRELCIIIIIIADALAQDRTRSPEFSRNPNTNVARKKCAGRRACVVAGATLSLRRRGAVWFRLFTLSTNLFNLHLFKRVFLFSFWCFNFFYFFFSFLSGLLRKWKKRDPPPPPSLFIFGCEISPKCQNKKRKWEMFFLIKNSPHLDFTFSLVRGFELVFKNCFDRF